MHGSHDDLEALYVLENLGKSYRMGEVDVVALKNINITIRRGELVVILGASGSGKSTLMNIIGGLDVPTTGAIRFRTTDLTSASDTQRTSYRRCSIGFVFQFYNLIPSLTARENVQLVTDLTEDPLDVEEMLGLVGLADRMDHFPSQLSGGEQQRVAIARAIAKRPDVLLCDEPTGALDLATGIVVLDVIEQIHQRFDTTVVLITHNASIAKMADRVVLMRSGEIVDTYSVEKRTAPKDLVW
jgi:putative ABC transport system ATP-binding protein